MKIQMKIVMKNKWKKNIKKNNTNKEKNTLYTEVGSYLNKPPFILSTSPIHKKTHWKQVMFMLPKGPVSVSAGDLIEGSIKIIRNKTWRRHFQTSFHFKISSDPSSAKGTSSTRVTNGTNNTNTVKDFQCSYDLWR